MAPKEGEEGIHGEKRGCIRHAVRQKTGCIIIRFRTGTQIIVENRACFVDSEDELASSRRRGPNQQHRSCCRPELSSQSRNVYH